jgi:hypothetical protein
MNVNDQSHHPVFQKTDIDAKRTVTVWIQLLTVYVPEHIVC